MRAVDGERLLCGEWLFTQPREKLYESLMTISGSSSPPDIVYRLLFPVVAFKPRLLADHAAYLDRTRRFAQLLEGPYVSSESNGYDNVAVDWWNALTNMLAPSSHINNIYRRMVADVRMTRTGLALLEYRKRHGRWPEALDELDEVLIDPFTEEPLHYRPEGEGFLIYSVGEDQKDNGGHEQQRRQHTDYDFIWRFPGVRTEPGPASAATSAHTEDD